MNFNHQKKEREEVQKTITETRKHECQKKDSLEVKGVRRSSRAVKRKLPVSGEVDSQNEDKRMSTEQDV
jgi:hypothetical protein